MSEPKKTPRVFVVQQPAYYDRDKGGFVPKYDLSPASEHGTITFMLGPGNIFRDRLAQAVTQMTHVLHDFGEDDFLLAVGDPVAIAAAVLIAGKRNGGRIKILKWDRIANSYESFALPTE